MMLPALELMQDARLGHRQVAAGIGEDASEFAEHLWGEGK
jgi:DNA-binding ferritin-like protein (Dps family)